MSSPGNGKLFGSQAWHIRSGEFSNSSSIFGRGICDWGISAFYRIPACKRELSVLGVLKLSCCQTKALTSLWSCRKASGFHWLLIAVQLIILVSARMQSKVWEGAHSRIDGRPCLQAIPASKACCRCGSIKRSRWPVVMRRTASLMYTSPRKVYSHRKFSHNIRVTHRSLWGALNCLVRLIRVFTTAMSSSRNDG